jgi:hypothetical protein
LHPTPLRHGLRTLTSTLLHLIINEAGWRQTRMKCSKILAALLVGASLALAPMMPAQAAINSMGLGASYNAQKTSITFQVYSSQASRIVLYLYASG